MEITSRSGRNNRRRWNSSGSTSRGDEVDEQSPPQKKLLENTISTTSRRRDSSLAETIFDGWSGQLADLQNETIRILSKVRRKKGATQQHTVGKGWAPIGVSTQTQAPPSLRTISASVSQRFGRSLSTSGNGRARSQPQQSQEASSSPTFPPLHQGRLAWENEESTAPFNPSMTTVGSINLLQRQRVEEAEDPIRTLDFDYERERVAEAKDTFIPHKDVRLTVLEREKARLEKLALHRQEMLVKQERQRIEVAARREWLKRDVAALKIERLYRGHLGRRRFALIREMTKIERDAEAAWLEVRDETKGEKWYFNPTTGISQWDTPTIYLDRIVPAEKIRRLGVAEMLKSSKQEEREEEDQNHNSGAGPESEEMPLDGSLALPPLFGASPGRPSPADDEEDETEAGMFGQQQTRFFSMDGKKNAALRQTVSQALKSSKWDSVATLIAGMTAAAAEAGEKEKVEESEPIKLEKHVAKRKKLFADPTSSRPMVALVKVNAKNKATNSPSRPRTSAEKLTKFAKQLPPSADENVLGLSIRDASTPGFEAPLPPVTKESDVGEASETEAAADKWPLLVKEVCFNCWSAGRGKKCVLHNVDKDGHPVNQYEGESQLMCRNWDLSVLRRRYRSEEIQEIFAKSASSLRYDRKRKVFVTVVEQKHPIYRTLNALIAKHHLRMRTVLHTRMWMTSLIDYFRRKDTASIFGDRKDVGKLYRASVSIRSFFDLKRFTKQNKDHIPVAPITGRSLPELSGEVQYLYEETDSKTGEVRHFIVSPPIPVPNKLYQARRYDLPVPLSIELPVYHMQQDGSRSRIQQHDQPPQRLTLDYKDDEGQRIRSLHHIADRLVQDTLHTASDQVISPPGPITKKAQQLEYIKYPPPVTVRFAKISRKPTNSMMAVGGFSPELVISQLVQTFISAQYGNFMAMETSSISPGISPEITMSFRSLEVPFTITANCLQECPLQHAVNTRKSPAIALMTGIKPMEKHACGLNRPEQTGESVDVGFRTSQHADGLPIVSSVNPWVFTPTAEVATLNKARTNERVTSNADLDYPFCEPSSRPSTTMDYYHLLLTGICTANKPQVFTAIGMQLPGQYLKSCDKSKPLGPIVTAVYRSWAFTQKSLVEEFLTDDGVPYWYDRRTKETYWEKPLMPAEQVPIKEGGTVLGTAVEAAETESGVKTAKANGNSGACIRYATQNVRKIILRKLESPEEMQERRTRVARSARERLGDDPEILLLRSKQAAAAAVTAPQGGGVTTTMGLSRPTSPSSAAAAGGAGGKIDPTTPGRKASVVALEASPRRKMSVINVDGAKSMMSETSASALLSPTRRASTVLPGEGEVPTTPGRTVTTAAITTSTQSVQKALPTLKKADELVVRTISNAIAEALQGHHAAQSPDDLVRLGMGLGISLQANGLLEGLKKSATAAEPITARKINVEPSDPGTEIPMVSKEWVTKREEQLQQRHPVGVPDLDPLVGVRPISKLDHSSEEALQERIRTAKPLSLLEKVKGLTVVPTPTPDEASRETTILMDPMDKIIASIPVLAKLESLLEKENLSHSEGGMGSGSGEAEGKKEVDTLAQAGKLRTLRDPLPVGFLNAIYDRHVAKQHVDYLPDVPNLPQLNCIGAIKPRSAAEDWLSIGFDPWSAGKEILFTDHIKMLTDQKVDISDLEGSGITVQKGGDGGASGAYIDTIDREGRQKQTDAQAELQIFEERFNLLASYCRHNKYREIEETISQVEWELPIDYADKYGNTILHVAVQNGSKRITKLLLRRGADINKQNLSGDTVLHYAYAYGFEELGEYLKSKGAGDTIANIDGLTCYEGLHVEDIEAL